jgi:hypothetical protein
MTALRGGQSATLFLPLSLLLQRWGDVLVFCHRFTATASCTNKTLNGKALDSIFRSTAWGVRTAQQRDTLLHEE